MRYQKHEKPMYSEEEQAMARSVNHTGLKNLPWYYVPPTGNEGHKIVNCNGELVATFEDKDEAIKVWELVQERGNG